MPGWSNEIGYIPPTDPRRFKLDVDGDKERRHRRKLFAENERYYNGDMSDPLIVDDDDPINDNVILSILKQTVDRTLSFVFPDIPRLVIDPDIDENPDEQYIDETLRINGGLVFLNGLVYNGALAGHVFVKVMEADPTLEGSEDFPRLINLHPSNITIFWDASDQDRVLWYENQYSAGEDSFIQDTWFDKNRWLTQTYVKPKGKQRWQTRGELAVWDSILSPIVDVQHLPDAVRKYGKSDITTDLRKLNDGVNRVASDVSRILKHHAFPKTVVTGASSNEINKTEIGALYSIANPDAKVTNLEMESDLASSMNFLDKLIDNVYLTERVVKVTGNVKDYQRVTNASIRSVYLDQIAKNQLLRWSYGELLQKIARRILLLKYEGNQAKAVRPTVLWQDPLPMDDTESINTLAIERNMHIVSEETASKKRGYDWDSEKEKQIDEQKLPFNQVPNEGGSQLAKTAKENISV